MGRAGGGGFSSSRSSRGSSRSIAAVLLLAYIAPEVLGALLEADRARADYKYLYEYSFSPSTRSAVCAQVQLKSPLKSPSPSHYDLQARQKSTDGSGSPESEEPHLNSHSRGDTAASTLVHSGGPTVTWPSSGAVFQYSDTNDLLLGAYFRSLSGDTWQQQEAGIESPGLKEAAADAESRNANLPGEGSIALGSLVWAEKVDRIEEFSVGEKDGYVGADASRALERTRADVGKSGALEGTRLYAFDADAKKVITVVQIQVALLGQATSVQLQMDKLCEEAKTGSKEGLHNLLTGVSPKESVGTLRIVSS
ncbi:hypothetical protein KFL_000060910 [Klebsormidium nitens]|uniref:Uncharacterized protein n=1 Tax=Klebsormidium nitens TaxID=105231 RepID=A0A0U9HM49_KLENI|nr:hypothetical protein KFL_000060910 [Klebsormidium nitens]|eukprot:GAQ78024.1 hypothetical protein KFL_000060910 [Klebsormidium nitens]